ncbi:hypothetical protein [Phenylobacterium conjunctum]|uniref:Uncharacterized protein n=1 Tax=Phenylobacterium conjunctum TaxID=1298959 RepID=A0ABW3T4A8_9CAUL
MIAQRIGFSLGPGVHATFDGVSGTRLVQPGLAFCTCATPANVELRKQGRTAIIEILDVDELGRRLAAAHPDRLGAPTARSVRYENRVFRADQPILPEPNAFIKDKAFQSEKEIRIVWPTISGEIPEQFTTAAPGIAPLLRHYA